MYEYFLALYKKIISQVHTKPMSVKVLYISVYIAHLLDLKVLAILLRMCLEYC